ncbi:TIGR01458 family HAD-type hydrolase [Microtetraspora sp. NBRC 16547]|uniref:TIGR01458 family HAD-type hydrolase n=1 Tax=Microtetraspora sp. NBRC 16547 TaxID=3030993 RepID=UPI0024A108FB|nr:TIGR01458 family HAD-type hydrolase [Microtetraspora sp. NBRC 16547]GLW99651.1 putative HAD-superfamily hydrolase [Microtetraspora sp. NBRC 16547]
MTVVKAVLIDIDGVLTVSWRPIPGAADALSRLRDQGRAIALVTNTTSHTRAWLARTLTDAGFSVSLDDIVTAPTVTASYLASHHPRARCTLLNSGDIRADLPGVELVEDDPDVVIVGGAGPEFSYEALNQAFAYLHGGARLVAMARTLYWRTDRGLQLDGGAFLAGLEQAAGVEAEVVGKPSPAFFAAALDVLGASPAEAIMVGDDVQADVIAAQRCGISGVLVRTGKYLPRAHQLADPAPDHVIDSFADLPALLDALEA